MRHFVRWGSRTHCQVKEDSIIPVTSNATAHHILSNAAAEPKESVGIASLRQQFQTPRSFERGNRSVMFDMPRSGRRRHSDYVLRRAALPVLRFAVQIMPQLPQTFGQRQHHPRYSLQAFVCCSSSHVPLRGQWLLVRMKPQFSCRPRAAVRLCAPQRFERKNQGNERRY